MNGSRSNTINYGGKSSLDQLNRTIEGLEARIQGLVSERKPAARSIAGNANPVEEILERQRALGGARDRVSAAIDRGPRREFDHRDRAVHGEHEPRTALRPQSSEMADIAATLAALRNELHQGLSEGVVPELGEIRADMHNLRQTAAQTDSRDIRNELARLGDSIDRLGTGGRSQGIDDLRGDLEELRTLTGSLAREAHGFAREDSIRGLEQRLENTDSRISAMDPDLLKEELVQLAWRIDDIKVNLGEMSAAPAIRALEDKLITVATAIETLGRNVENRGDLTEQFSSLDSRLDEITRAIAVSAKQAGGATDGVALQRLESRINELVTHIDALQNNGMEAEIAARIDALTLKIEDLADEEAAVRLEERVEQLSRLIERNFRETQAPDLSSGLADLSRKIDGLESPRTDELMRRLEMLATKLDEFEPSAEPTTSAMADMAAVSRLESRLIDIAARLDETSATPAGDSDSLRSLENQIAQLSTMISEAGRPSVTTSPEADARMAAIEDYLASSDEFIVEAARQAAEAVVDAYSRSNLSAQSVSAGDIAALTGLADDLRALEAHTRSSEERTAETFSALHQTLVQIAGRLDDIGERTMPIQQRQPHHEEMVDRHSTPMPKAAQPDFADQAPAAPAERPRTAPRNAQVEVLEDGPELEEAADADISADAVDPAEVGVKSAKTGSRSLIAGLAARLKPSKKAKTNDRLSVEPAPALDAGEMLVPNTEDMPLEPGSGVPDVKKIMEKVRAGQKAAAAGGNETSKSHTDVIAAARRAAQAAAQETSSHKPEKNAKKPKIGAKESKSLFGNSEARRPIVLAAAAVLLVIMSYPLVSGMISGRGEPVEPEPVPAVVEPTNTDSAVEAEPSEQTIEASSTATPTESVSETTPVVTPDAVDTGTRAMMLPADNAENATSLQASPGDDAPVEDNAGVDPRQDAAIETTAVEGEPATATETETQATEATPQVDVTLPAGLQPAALVEAARKADPLAYFEIGARYTDGRGVKTDLAEAAKWYQLAADKGFAPAEYRLASFYEKGTGVERDVEKARMIYLSAAEKGNASAMHNLAVLLATGGAGTPDFDQAARWFTEAANMNVRDSQFNLAILYARGTGVAQDLGESYKWFAVAAKQGDKDAAQKRDEIANALTSEQLKDAKAKLDLWTPKLLDDDANNPVVPDTWLAKSKTTATVDMKRAIRNIQTILNNNGFESGVPDGEMGGKTIAAIKAFQKSVGQEPTGKIDDALVRELLKRNKKA